jgi:hypothetical protein
MEIVQKNFKIYYTKFKNSSWRIIFTVFRLLTDFVCLYTYEFW